MSQLFAVLGRRRMCRAYQERPVPRALLLRLLEAARRAPSAGHSQGVRYGVVTCPERRLEIARAYGEEGYLEKGFQPWLSRAPVHLVVATSLPAYRERYSQPDKSVGPEEWPIPYPVLDVGQSLMSLYLAAEEFGLACGYLGPHAGPDLVELLHLPEDWTFAGLVTLGYREKGREHRTRSSRLGWREFDQVVKWI